MARIKLAHKDTPLLRELVRIMDLEDPTDEARKKLERTWMVVNGELLFIKEFFFDDSCVFTQDPGTGEDIAVIVETLDVFLPEAGLYPIANGNILYINKIPKRQWLKSYHDSFYTCKVIGSVRNATPVLPQIVGKNKQDIAVDKNQGIWYWDTLIGHVKDSMSIICINTMFKQELIDWSRDA